MKHHDKIVFKPYEMNQPMLLPPDLEEMIPENHLVRLVNKVIENMDIEPLLESYKGGGKSQPDFRTINRFRSSRLKEAMDNVFAFVVQTLMEHKLINLKDYFIDGTKIEANTNKYTFVWSKSTKRFKGRIPSKIQELLKQIRRMQ